MFQRPSQTEADTSRSASNDGDELLTTDPLADVGTDPTPVVPGSDETLRAVRKTKLRGTLLMVAMITVGGGLLYGMRMMGVSKRLTMKDVKIDYPLERAEQSVTRAEHERVIRALASSENVIQVPLEQVQMNPFALRSDAEAAAPTENGPSAEELAAARSAKERDARVKKLQDALKKLKLNSVVASGHMPVAQISGQVVKIGDIVAEEFIVGKIKQRSVVLLADGQEYELEIGGGK